MCGRYALARTTDDLVREYDIDQVGWDDPPAADYNIAPTKPVPVVTPHENGRRLVIASWGLVPWWSADPRGAAKMINARSETVAVKPAYREALVRRRCLIPADGWYEWAITPDAGRRPHYITPRDGTVLTFAGLYELWGPGPDRLLTCSILTTEARGALRDIHHRMPVMLPRSHRAAWLGTGPGEVTVPPVPDALELREVSPAVGNVRNAGPGLIEPAPDRHELPEQQVLL